MNQTQKAKKSLGRLAGCLLFAAWICVAQMSGNSLLIAGCLVAYLAFSVYAAMCGYATLLLFFFLPWSPVLKLSPGSFSFYTFAMVAICMVCLLRAGWLLPTRCLAAAVLLLGLTTLSKVLDGTFPELSYIMFMFLLVLFPLTAAELKRSVDFLELTLFFSAGIIAAALSAAMLVRDPNIARYVNVYSWNGMTRRSGFYGDANFYAAQITAALSGVLMLLPEMKTIRSALLHLALCVLLLYCGLLSASKSFAITALATGLVWCVWYLRSGFPLRSKLILFAGFLAAIGIGIAFGVWDELVKTLLFRFRQGSSLADFTTGRTELWLDYLSAITADPKLFLLGKGFTNVKLNGAGSHNTLLQLWYQFGLAGSLLLVLWQLFEQQTLMGKTQCSRWDGRFLAVLIGVFLPWMAIDMLFFDEFFLMPIYVMAAGRWMERGR